MTMTEKIKVVGYCRISKAKENDVSLPAQLAKIRQWADLHDAEVIGVYEDNGISGTRADNRPGLQAALDKTIKNRAVLVVYSLSRSFRSTIDAITNVNCIQKAGAELVSLSENIDTTTAAGRMIFRTFASLAEFEADLGGERTKAALDFRRSKGLKTGGYAPYGYDVVGDEGRLVKNADEQREIGYMRKMITRGHTLSHIARRLNERGIKTKNGKKWYAQTVKNLLNYKPIQTDEG